MASAIKIVKQTPNNKNKNNKQQRHTQIMTGNNNHPAKNQVQRPSTTEPDILPVDLCWNGGMLFA
eukprot:4803485-Amphidinium_carterae.1